MMIACKSLSARTYSNQAFYTSFRAFTLVEMLVCTGIIGALIAVILPSVTAVRANAKVVVCISNIRQLGIALRLYACDNKDSYPINVSTPQPNYWNDSTRISQYIMPPNLPMDRSSVFWCPEDTDAQQSYSMNIWASSAADKSVVSLATGQIWPHRRQSSSFLLLAESWSYQSGPGIGFLPTATIGCRGSSAAQRFGALGGIAPYSAGRWGQVNCELTFARHRVLQPKNGYTQPVGRVTILFDDGHASLCSNTDLVNSCTDQSTGSAVWSAMDFVKN